MRRNQQIVPTEMCLILQKSYIWQFLVFAIFENSKPLYQTKLFVSRGLLQEERGRLSLIEEIRLVFLEVIEYQNRKKLRRQHFDLCNLFPV